MTGRRRPKFYAVTRGKDDVCGIFTNWNDCSPFVTGVKKVIYQGYTTLSQAKIVLIQGGYEPKVYKDGVWLSCQQFEEESVTNPSYDEDSSHSISDEENLELPADSANITCGDFDLSQEIEESIDLDETILKAPIDREKDIYTANSSPGTVDLTRDSCSTCGEKKSQFMLQCDECQEFIHYNCTLLPSYELAKYMKTKSKKIMCSSCCENDTKLAKLMDEISKQPGNVSNNNDSYQSASLIRNELEEFKNTTMRSMEMKFTEALAKINTNTVIDELENIKDKTRKVLENQNKLTNVLLSPKDSSYEAGKAEKTIKLLEKENTTLQASLTAKIASLEDHGHRVQSLKDENAELKLQISTLKLEKQKLQHSADFEKQRRSDYGRELELKHDSLVECRNTLSEYEDKCRSLQREINKAQDEILGLKSQVGTDYMNPEWSSVNSNISRHEGIIRRSPERPKKPLVLLVGTSNTRNIDPEKFMSKVVLHVTHKYTIEEALSNLNNIDKSPDVIIYHIITNDLKNKSSSNCMDALSDLIGETEKIFPETKIVLSTATHRNDSDITNLKVSSINAMIKEAFHDKQSLTICDNDNMAQNSRIHSNLIKDDGYHLSDDGVRVLASNIRKCVEKVLSIEPAVRFAKGTDGDGFNHNRRRVPNRGQSQNRQPGDRHSGGDSPVRYRDTGYRRNYSPERSSSVHERQRWDRRDR